MATLAENPPRTVLLIEDEPPVRRLIKRILLTESAKILTAGSGARALQIAARTAVDLVILDVKLPDMSGTEVLRRLRDIDGNVAVIMVTGYGSPGSVRAAMELGAFDYLTKPFSNEEMSRVVREALASRRVGPIRRAVSLNS